MCLAPFIIDFKYGIWYNLFVPNGLPEHCLWLSKGGDIMEHKYHDLGLVAGANLKRLIKESKYGTQEEFAFEFGADVRTIGRWINHGIDKLSTIMQIAEFFGIDVLDIFSI